MMERKKSDLHIVFDAAQSMEPLGLGLKKQSSLLQMVQLRQAMVDRQHCCYRR